MVSYFDQTLRHRRAFGTIAFMFAIGLAGCASEPPPGPPKLVPVSGTVTHEGKPLVGAIVQFNPTVAGEGSLCIGETDESGKYQLSHVGYPGCSPGSYKVAISLTMSTEGKPVTIAQNSSLSPHPATLGAKEIIPKNYSSLGETSLTAVVPERGGSFDFDVPGPFLDPPAPVEKKPEAEPAAPPAEAPKAEPAKPEAPKAADPAPAAPKS